jgi:hypothetical protein
MKQKIKEIMKEENRKLGFIEVRKFILQARILFRILQEII